MVQFCGDCGGNNFRIEPDTSTRIEHDYWEDVVDVQNAFVADPSVALKTSQNPTSKTIKPEKKVRFKDEVNGTVNGSHGHGSLVPVPVEDVDNRNEETETDKVETEDEVRSNADNSIKENGKSQQENKSGRISQGEDQSNEQNRTYPPRAHQNTEIDGEIDHEKKLGYCFCFCCRTGTPCSVWIFIGCSFIFFKMGAIVTGRWIYLWQSSYDEVAFYAAFSVNLGFATFYFRHGTKHHNPFDILCLLVTTPLLWGLLTFTTILYKKDTFFYVATGFYSTLVFPYTLIGAFITYKFWTSGKLFMKRVEGNKELEPLCRKLFFAHNLMIFDMQAITSASIIAMAPSLNHSSTYVWIASLVYGPLSIAATISWFTIGYMAIRKENRLLTWIFTALSGNPIILVAGILWKMPKAVGILETFRNCTLIFSVILLLIVHISLIVFIWTKITPSYGKGLRKSLSRTSENSCIQCAEITICR